MVLGLVLAFACFLHAGSAYSRSSYRDDLLREAETRQLWKERAWRKILLIPDLWYPSDRSIIDDPSAFLDPDGRKNPRSELLATLEALFDTKREERLKIPCRYPARFHWLSKALSLDPAKIPEANCEALEKYLEFAADEGATLVFSNYYVDNPSSMFGHTFLRLKRPGTNDQALLDDIVNFAAFMPAETEWLYPIKGLAGGYKGKFSIMPYYSKIEEYNNYESRDLWEYDLNLTSEEIRFLHFMLWELGPVYIDYYFLDDNCSYIMLALLEAARPRLSLTSNLNLYAVPADTLRKVADSGLVSGVHYRPSSLSRFRSLYDRLDPTDQERVQRLVRQEADLGPDCEAECQARVIDAAMEYIDFKERLAGSRLPEKFAELRGKLLSRRAKTGIRKDLSPPWKEYSSRPDLGHPANALGLSIGAGTDFLAELRWRPALHELAANSIGYSDSMAVGFLENTWRYSENGKKVWFENLHAIEITSTPDQIPLIPSIGWHLDLAYERAPVAWSRDEIGLSYIQGGVGPSDFFFDQRLLLYSRVEAIIGGAERGGFIGPSTTFGAMLKIGERSKLNLRSDLSRLYFRKTDYDRIKHSLILSFFLSRKREMRLSAAAEQGKWESLVSSYSYF